MLYIKVEEVATIGFPHFSPVCAYINCTIHTKLEFRSISGSVVINELIMMEV